MKTFILQAGLAVGLVCATPVGAALYYNGTGGLIPDGSSSILQTITSSDLGTIGNVSLVLNISGGFNGDLYGYLTFNDGSTEKTIILLNRIGGGSSSASGSGFGTGATTSDYASLLAIGVNLADGAGGSIHNVTPGAGNYVAVGNYAPDSGTTFAATFGDMGASGTWNLLLFDRASGDQSTLVSWGLNITAVPEPATWALIGFGVMFAGAGAFRSWRNRSLAVQ